MSAIASKFTQKLTTEQLNKVIQVCQRLNLDPNWLLAVMFFETGQTFSPSIRNPIGSVGLIQFTRDRAGVEYKTIKGKQYPLDMLAKMSFVEQMDIVELYLKEAKGRKTIKSFTDLYLLVFFPLAVGKADDFVFKTSGLTASLIAKQNPAFDRNKDGMIHKAEVTTYFRDLYTKWGFKFDADINRVKASYIAPVLLGIAAFFFSGFNVIDYLT